MVDKSTTTKACSSWLEPELFLSSTTKVDRSAAATLYYGRFTGIAHSNRSVVSFNLKLAATRRTSARIAERRAKSDFG